MKNKKSAEEIAQMRKQDYVTNKLLLVFTFAFIFLMYIMHLDDSKSTLEAFLALPERIKTALWVSVGVFGAGVVWMLVEKLIFKRDTKYKLCTGLHLAVIGLFMTVCLYDLNSKLMSVGAEAFTRLYVFIPIVVILYIIYGSYQREFFFISLASALGGVAIWNMRDYVFGDPDMLAIIAAVIIAIICAVTVWDRFGNGQINVFGKNRKITVFKSDAKYMLMYVSYIAILALIVGAMFFAAYAMYALYAIVAYVVVMGVYYTIKLI